MFKFLYSLIWDICNYDWKFLIKHIYKYNLYSNHPFPTRQSVIDYFSVETVFDSLTQKQQEILSYELQNIKAYYKKIHGVDRNFTRQNLQKQVSDYKGVIQDLKNQGFNYRSKLLITDAINDTQTFEQYTNSWAVIQKQIDFLSREVRKMEKQLIAE